MVQSPYFKIIIFTSQGRKASQGRKEFRNGASQSSLLDFKKISKLLKKKNLDPKQ